MQQDSTLEVMLVHVNQVYALMGCLLQDIEFMVGNTLSYLGRIDKGASKNAGK